MRRMSVLGRLVDTLSWALWGTSNNCALCRKPTIDPEDLGVCPECRAEIALDMSNVCMYCGTPVRSPLRCCADCLRQLHSFLYQRSAGLYRGNLRSAIARMKYGGERWLSRPLGTLVAETAKPLGPVDVIVPIPLDPKSAAVRGFNQSEDLAAEVSRRISIPTVNVLTRAKRGEHQAALGRTKRWGNLRGSMFPNGTTDMAGKTVLLVDDVMTTGATLDEAARVAKSMGAKAVLGVTVARTVRQ